MNLTLQRRFYFGILVFGFLTSFIFTGCSHLKDLVGVGPEAPKISLESVVVNNVSAFSVDLAAKLKVFNPNSFGLDLNGFDYKVSSFGMEIAKGLYKRPINLRKNATSFVTIPLSVEPGKLIKFLKSYMTNHKNAVAVMNATVYLNTPLGEMNFEFVESKKISKVIH